MAGTRHARRTLLGTPGGRLRTGRGSLTRALALGLAFAAGLGLGACAVQWGDSGDDTPDASGQTPRDRNQLYLKEQQRQYQQQQMDRSGPSDR